MKKLIIILVLFGMFCTNTIEVPEQKQGNVVQDPVQPQPVQQPYTLAVKSGAVFHFYDGSQFVTTSYEHRFDTHKYTSVDMLYTLDDFGNETAQTLLVNQPSAMNQTYLTTTYLAAYTEIYNNNVLISDWTNNNYVTKKIIISEAGNSYAMDSIGVYHGINNVNINIRAVYEAGIDIHNFDAGTRTATISGNPVSWSTNYFTQAKQWVNIAGTWYSNNGYKWDGSTLTENGSSMSGWNAYPYPAQDIYGESPVVIAVGIFNEHGYFVECNTGFIIRYDPATDRTDALYRIYAGDGTRNSGNIIAAGLSPKIIDGVLYFNEGGQMWQVDILSGNVTSFFGSVGEVWRY